MFVRQSVLKRKARAIRNHFSPPIPAQSWKPITINSPPHIGPKSLILAPQDIPDISGYQLGFGCQCVKAYNNENPVTNQKIL